MLKAHTEDGMPNVTEIILHNPFKKHRRKPIFAIRAHITRVAVMIPIIQVSIMGQNHVLKLKLRIYKERIAWV